MANGAAIINVLPQVSSAVKIYFTVIANDSSFHQANITSAKVLYGNVNLLQSDLFIPYDNLPIAIAVTATYSGSTFVSILYTKAVYGNILPDNFTRLVQKIPLGIFSGGVIPAKIINGAVTDTGTLVGNDFKARSQMMDDYYQEYFFVKDQVWSTQYSPQLEFEYNGTVGLLSNSAYPDQLFQLLARLATVHLNSYDLELFVSKYIYYRTGIVSAVYIDDHIHPIGEYWLLGVNPYTTLNVSAILAPPNYNPVIENLDWLIFNSGTFSEEFQKEITNLVIRISRADIGNTVDFTEEPSPVDSGFTLIGPTYQNDPRLIDGKCLQYIGDGDFPLNIIGWVNNI